MSVVNCHPYVTVLSRLAELMCLSYAFILNTTNIFKVPEVPKKAVPVKKVPVVKKPEPPEAEGIHTII